MVPLLRVGLDFKTDDALKKYLQKHPKADKSRHHVTKSDGGRTPKKEEAPKGKAPGKEEAPKGTGNIPEDATLKDLPPQVREAIKDYKLDIVGDDAKQALDIAQKVKEGIEKAADICKIKPPICRGNKGLSRDKMPQIDGDKPVKEMLASDKPDERAKGEAMVQAGADPNSEKTIQQQMLDYLEKNGVKTTEETMPVGKMKATQTEIKAGKVYGMADSHLKGKFPNIDGSVVVSSDGHILDGHHRWAALLTIDPGRNMRVKKIDMTMDELLKEAASFPGVYKADFAGKPLSEKDQKEYKSKNKSRWGQSKKEAALLKKLIRLAHEKPEVRAAVLPLVRRSLQVR